MAKRRSYRKAAKRSYSGRSGRGGGRQGGTFRLVIQHTTAQPAGPAVMPDGRSVVPVAAPKRATF